MSNPLFTELAARQHGVVASWQFRSQLASHVIRYELARSGRWVQMAPQVFVLNGVPPSDLTNVMAAVLIAGPGAHVAFGSAAAMWGWRHFDHEVVNVQRAKSSNRMQVPTWVRFHESRRLPPTQLTVLDGIPISSPERTLVDVCRNARPGRAERMLEWGWNERLYDGHSLVACLDELGRRGQKVVTVLQAMIDERGVEWVPPASGLESRVGRTLERNRLGKLRRQVDIGGSRWIGKVDILHELNIIIEVQSDRFHASLAARRDDEQRFEALRDAGFVVFEVWESEIWHPDTPWIPRFRDLVNELRRVRGIGQQGAA